MGKYAASSETDEEHEELDNDEPRKEGVSHGSVLGEKLRPRLEPLNDQAAHEHGGHRFPRNAQCQCGNERTAGNGIVCRFRTGDAFNGAAAEIFRLFGELFCCIIAQEAGDRSARAREDADDVPDEPGADDGRPDLFQLMEFQHDGVVEFNDASSFLNCFFRKNENLGKRKETDEGTGDINAVVQFVYAEHEPFRTFHGIHADGGKNEAEGTAHKPFHHGARGNARNDGESEESKPEIFRASEFHGQFGKHGSKEIKRNTGKETAEERSDACRAECLAGFSLFGEFIPVERRCRGSGCAGGMDQDGGNRTAEDGAAVNAAEHDQSRFGSHAEGKRQKKRYAHGGGKARHTADNDSDGDADNHHD